MIDLTWCSLRPWLKPLVDKNIQLSISRDTVYLLIERRYYEIKTIQKMRMALVRFAWDYHAKSMMITSSWYVAYRAPTELCKVLLMCQVEFYMSLVCLGFLSKSLEAAVPWKFWPRSKFFGSFDSFKFWKLLVLGIPRQVGLIPYVRVQKGLDSWPMSGPVLGFIALRETLDHDK